MHTGETEGRLKGLPAADKEATDVQKALRVVWTERLALIDEWEKAVKARKEAENPEPSPDKEVARLTDEIEHRKAMLGFQLAKALPETVLCRDLPDPRPAQGG